MKLHVPCLGADNIFEINHILNTSIPWTAFVGRFDLSIACCAGELTQRNVLPRKPPSLFHNIVCCRTDVMVSLGSRNVLRENRVLCTLATETGIENMLLVEDLFTHCSFGEFYFKDAGCASEHVRFPDSQRTETKCRPISTAAAINQQRSGNTLSETIAMSSRYVVGHRA